MLRLMSLSRRGVTPIIGEILLIGIIVAAMSVVAAYVLTQPIAHERERYVNLDAEVFENAAASYKVVKVVIYHRGGETIDNPAEHLTVRGGETGWQWWENRAYDVVFSNTGKFAMGDNLTCHIRHDDAYVRENDTFWVHVYDDYSESSIFLKNFTVKAPS